MAIKLGMEAVLNYKVGGQGGGGSWNALGNTRDVTLNLETGEADVTARANSGWRATVATLEEASVEFEMVWDTVEGSYLSERGFVHSREGPRLRDSSDGEFAMRRSG